MINIFLAPNTNPNPPDAPSNFTVEYINIFPGQTSLSFAFLWVIFACVPLMLCVKPCVFLCNQKKHQHDHVEEEGSSLKEGSNQFQDGG